MYAIVEFQSPEEAQRHDVSIVPYVWLIKNETQCYWPLSTNKLPFAEFVRRETPYKKNWPKYKISKVHYKTDSYIDAEETLAKILACNEETTSSSNNTVKSLVQKQIIYGADSSSSESDCESTPLSKQSRQHDVCDLAEDAVAPSPNIFNRSDNRFQDPVDSPASTVTVTSDYTSNFTEIVLRELAGIKANVENQSLLLAEIARCYRSQNTLQPPPECPDFPLKNLEEYEKLNTILAENTPIREYLVKRLAAVGGSGVEQLTRRIMKFLMTNELACLFNWKGRDKIAFENTKIMGVVYDASKLNFPQQERNDKLISGAVKDWLKLASSRLKRTAK